MSPPSDPRRAAAGRLVGASPRSDATPARGSRAARRGGGPSTSPRRLSLSITPPSSIPTRSSRSASCGLGAIQRTCEVHGRGGKLHVGAEGISRSEASSTQLAAVAAAEQHARLAARVHGAVDRADGDRVHVAVRGAPRRRTSCRRPRCETRPVPAIPRHKRGDSRIGGDARARRFPRARASPSRSPSAAIAATPSPVAATRTVIPKSLGARGRDGPRPDSTRCGIRRPPPASARRRAPAAADRAPARAGRGGRTASDAAARRVEELVDDDAAILSAPRRDGAARADPARHGRARPARGAARRPAPSRR